MSLDLSIIADTGTSFVPFLRKQVAAAHVLAAKARSSGRLRELSLVLVGDARMTRLHQQFMNIAAPTDVLTFPMDTDAAARVTSGEVVLCVPQARRSARERKIPTRLELLLYALHGMLHLLGYDDRNARAFQAMHRTEDQILTQLGFGPVFAAAPAAGALQGARR